MTATTIISTAQSNIFVPSEVEQLRAEVQRERARADRAEAMLKNADQTAKQLTELRKIFRGNDWGPTERGTLAAMKFQAWEQNQTTSQWLHVCEGGAAVLANIVGVSRGTANNIVQRLTEAGLVSREVSNTPVNRYRQEIKARYVNEEHGDGWLNSSTIAIAATLPDTLPELPNNTERAKAKRVTQSQTRKLANIAKKALQLPCPCCGVVGELHIACTACKHTFTANELVELEQQARQRDTTETTRRAKPMTNDQKHKATQRRRMRETRGVASTPGASVTYEYDDQTPGELDIIIINAPQSEQNLRVSTLYTPIETPKSTGEHTVLNRSDNKNCAVFLNECTNSVSTSYSVSFEGTNAGGDDGPPTDWDVIMGGGANV